MNPFRRTVAVIAVAAASALALSGCAGGAPAADDGRISVVASTNVYGQIAEEIGGDLVSVTAIINSAAQDPHSFEASARDQLTVSRAALIIANGGGYDTFMDALIDGADSGAPVIIAAELSEAWPGDAGHAGQEDAAQEHSGDHDHADHGEIDGFNEHVWYDPQTVARVALAIAHELSGIDPAHADEFAANAKTFTAGIDKLEASLADLAAAHTGTEFFMTEPVPGYLAAAAGLVNVTPPAFSEAVEEGQDVPPATLLGALDLIRSGRIAVLIVNAQTGGAETSQVIDEAKKQGIPVLEFTETLPEGKTYLSWMQANIEALAGALAQ